MVHGESLTTGRPGMIFGIYHQRRKQSPEYDAAIGDEMHKNPERFIQSILFDSQDRKVAGFKFKTEESFSQEYRKFSDIVFNDTDIKVIHLKRRSLLDQYISHQVVLNQTGLTLLLDTQDKPEIKPFRADTKHSINYFKDVIEREQRAHSVYSKHRSIEVEYENIIHEDSDHRTKALDFLEVDHRPLSTATKKIIEDSRALITNLDELIAGLSDAGFVDRLS
jgi:hypothetical protein